MERSSKKYTAFAIPGSGSIGRRAFWAGSRAARLDDIIVVTEIFEEHLKWVKLVLERLVNSGLKVNEEKCEFCCSSFVYLGFLLDCEGLRPNPSKVQPVLDYPTPKSVK